MCVECITSSKDSEKLEKSLCVRDKLETYIRQEWDQIATPKLQKLITSMPFELFWKEEEMLHHCKRASVPNTLRPVAGIQVKHVLHYLCSIVNIGSFDVKIFYANLKMSQHSRNSCCIYLSVCLINIISRSELVRISSVSALSFRGEWEDRTGRGGSGILESSNPGSGRYEEKNPPSYAFTEEEYLLWATEQAQDKHARSQQFTSAWLVNLRTPRDIRASLWMINIPNSRDVEVFSRFIYAPGPKPIVWFNWLLATFSKKQARCSREIWLSGLLWLHSAWDIFYGGHLFWSIALQT